MFAIKVLMCIIFLLAGGGMKSELKDYFYDASEVIVSIDGKETALKKGDDKYEQVMSALLETTKNSHEMPAFGVSLDDMTREDKKHGVWIELVFDGTLSHNEMPFEALLIFVKNDYRAFNLVRKNNGKYEGRCFHLSLEKDLQKLNDVILSLSV